MIYINLPDLYGYGSKLEPILSKLAKDKETQHLFITPITLVSHNLEIPYCYMNSNFNNHQGSLLNWDKLHLIANEVSSQAPRINLANIFIEEKDKDNTYLDVILNAFHNGSTQIELCNPHLINHIKEKYPNYSFVFSAKADYINPLTEDILNIVLNDEIFDLVCLPSHLVNNEILTKLSHRNKLELQINNLCNSCGSFYECSQNEQEKIYNFSRLSPMEICPKLKSYEDMRTVIIPLEDIIHKYTKLGITHYSLGPLPNNQRAILDFLAFFVNYFVKVEYRFEIYKLLEREVI